MKKGISLIVLVITIIVIIILASAVILSLANNNPIAQATEAKFKTNMEAYSSELNMLLSKKYVDNSAFDPKTFNATAWDGVSATTGTVKEFITSVSAEDGPKLLIQNGKLVYNNKATSVEEDWLSDLNIAKITESLNNLTLTGATISPAFNPNTLAYTSNVGYDKSSITVVPTAIDGNTTVTVNGVAVVSGQASQAIALNVGSNTITVVISINGVPKTYTITVSRASTPYMSACVVKYGVTACTLAPAFNKSTYAYTTSVPALTASITVTPTLEDATATVKVNGVAVASGAASGAITLVTGVNNVTVTTTSKTGGDTKTYTIAITKP